jgi:hypothetical protein
VRPIHCKIFEEAASRIHGGWKEFPQIIVPQASLDLRGNAPVILRGGGSGIQWINRLREGH